VRACAGQGSKPQVLVRVTPPVRSQAVVEALVVALELSQDVEHVTCQPQVVAGQHLCVLNTPEAHSAVTRRLDSREVLFPVGRSGVQGELLSLEVPRAEAEALGYTFVEVPVALGATVGDVGAVQNGAAAHGIAAAREDDVAISAPVSTTSGAETEDRRLVLDTSKPVDLVGRGGHGQVFRGEFWVCKHGLRQPPPELLPVSFLPCDTAYCVDNPNPVAIKILLATVPGHNELIRAEHQRLAKFPHDNIVGALGWCSVDTNQLDTSKGLDPSKVVEVAISLSKETAVVRALVMEYMPLTVPEMLQLLRSPLVGDSSTRAAGSTSLVTLFARAKVMWMWQAARGLAYLHGCNVVHCDIKPDNMLLTSQGVLKLSDFGISVDRPDGVHTITDAANRGTHVRGTKEFTNPALLIRGGRLNQLAPSSVRGLPGGAPTGGARTWMVSRANDCFSFVCTLFHVLTGRMPWWGALTATYTELEVVTATDGQRFAVRHPLSSDGRMELTAALGAAGCAAGLVDRIMTHLDTLLRVRPDDATNPMQRMQELLYEAMWAGSTRPAAGGAGGPVSAAGGADDVTFSAVPSELVDAARDTAKYLSESKETVFQRRQQVLVHCRYERQSAGRTDSEWPPLSWLSHSAGAAVARRGGGAALPVVTVGHGDSPDRPHQQRCACC